MKCPECGGEKYLTRNQLDIVNVYLDNIADAVANIKRILAEEMVKP